MKGLVFCLAILLIVSPNLGYDRLKEKLTSVFKIHSEKKTDEPNSGRFLWFNTPNVVSETENDQYSSYQIQRMAEEINELDATIDSKCDKDECDELEKSVEKLQMDMLEITNILSTINTRISLMDSIIDPCNRYLNFDGRHSSYSEARNNPNVSHDQTQISYDDQFTARQSSSDCVSVIAQPCCAAAQEALAAANAAQASADMAEITANTALNTAEEAQDTATDASDAAGIAQRAAEAAQTTADDAETAAEAAQRAAEDASREAANAQTTADAAQQDAEAAQDTADDAVDAAADAMQAAEDAQDTADTALANAEDAQEAADAAQGTADDAAVAAAEESDVTA